MNGKCILKEHCQGQTCHLADLEESCRGLKHSQDGKVSGAWLQNPDSNPSASGRLRVPELSKTGQTKAQAKEKESKIRLSFSCGYIRVRGMAPPCPCLAMLTLFIHVFTHSFCYSMIQFYTLQNLPFPTHSPPPPWIFPILL